MRSPEGQSTTAAIRFDLGAIFVSLELSQSKWLVTSLSPGGGEKMSKHELAAGDLAGLLDLFERLREKARARTGGRYGIVSIQEAGLDGFWLHRALEAEGVESHVVDPASVAVSRRRRRAKTDRLDGEALLRTLLAYKRGEPRVCSMVRPPSPEQEDERRLSRERRTLVGERLTHVNRIKGLLSAQGIRGFKPLRRDRRARLEALQTGDGRPLGAHIRTQILREIDRLELLCEQIRAVETERDALLARLEQTALPDRPAPTAMLTNWSGSAPRPPRSCGTRGWSGPSATAVNWPPMPAWRRPPGRAARSIANRASPRPATPGCEPP